MGLMVSLELGGEGAFVSPRAWSLPGRADWRQNGRGSPTLDAILLSLEDSGRVEE